MNEDVIIKSIKDYIYEEDISFIKNSILNQNN
ncbi:MAG: hypothetical protein K0S93_730 [Nitrososphaeraceae archaeon]|nr:hypothetical protein [Nitrososphaeraceae archaeon]